MYISAIVPVFNEEKTIGTVLNELLLISSVKQIIVVDDGSTDKSYQVISKFSQKYKKIFVIKKSNQGKGSAIITALRKVTQEYVLIQDADLEYHPEDIDVLMEPIRKRKNVLVVYGSRFLGGRTNLLFWHMIGNRLINILTNILYDTTLSDLETCYKLIPTKVFRQLDLKSTGFEIEVEITCKILKMGLRIYEVPISYFGRDFSEGKKITWKDGLNAAIAIVKYRFN